MKISRVPKTALALLALSAAGAAPQIGSSGASTPIADQGLTGATGVSAIEDATGLIGACELTGVTGSSGSSGASGTTGSTDASCTTGDSGDSGATGTSGATSTTSASGTTGTTTTSTVAAPTGTTGVSGDTAATGTTDLPGTAPAAGVPGASPAPSVTSIIAQPTSGSALLATTKKADGGTEAGGALAPSPNLFSQANPLSGVLPGSVFDPFVNAALGADVPQFFVEHFNVPPFLLPIYQSAAAAYGIPWEVLAAINEVETNFGSDLNVSSAGAIGWMQFLPSTWKRYGVDATGSDVADPYNAADAIFAAARYLAAAGASHNLAAAIFAYNHSNAYVQSVLLRAELLSGVPTALVNSVSELAEGHFPVQLRYHPSYRAATQNDATRVSQSTTASRRSRGDAPSPTAVAAKVAAAGDHSQPAVAIYADAHAAVVAAEEGTIVAIGRNHRLGTFIRLEDSFGNRYTYGGLASISAYYPTPKSRPVTVTESLSTPAGLSGGPAPTAPASAGHQSSVAGIDTAAAAAATDALLDDAAASGPSDSGTILASLDLSAAPSADSLLFALSSPTALRVEGRLRPSLERALIDRYYTSAFGLRRDQLDVERLRVGSRVLAGTILGRLGVAEDGRDPHLIFELRPAGAGQALIDPRPFLDAWTQLETLELHRAKYQEPLYGPDLQSSDAGETLAMSQIDLERTVLNDSRVVIALCERRAIADGSVDRRVLATIEFLAQNGLDPTISGAECDTSTESAATSSVPAGGDSVTITAINGLPVLGNQGAGTETEAAIDALLTLSGDYAPASITSLDAIPGEPSTVADPSDAGQVVVSFTPATVPLALASTANYTGGFTLGATRWSELVGHLEQIPEPRVPTVISSAALRGRHHRAATR